MIQTTNTAALSVTANAASKVYGNADPAFSYTVGGFTNGDNASVMSGSLSRAAGEAVGTYAILQGSVSGGGNYTVSYAGANLSILPALVRKIAAGQSDINFVTLSAALAAVPDSGFTTLRLLNGNLGENLTFAANANVRLVGGYDADLALQQNGGMSRLNSPVKVTGGALSVSGVVVR
jgi:hypothetical protein